MRENFDEYLAAQLEKFKGIAYPIKSYTIERALIRYAKCMSLHPNPEDEFSKPDVGPSKRIISEYERSFREADARNYLEEPIVVEKMHPEGYMIINGHHRWAAYYRIGRKIVPVNVVNLTHEADIRKMVEGSVNDKRVTMDLDEVVFGTDERGAVERRPLFPYNLIFKENIKAGTLSLLNYFDGKGYDVWLYTSKFYSVEYIRRYLKRYHVKITGIVTGTARNNLGLKGEKREVDKLLASKYKRTINIDSDTVLVINSETKEFEEHEIDKTRGKWSQMIMELIDKIDPKEENSDEK